MFDIGCEGISVFYSMGLYNSNSPEDTAALQNKSGMDKKS
jgi:hypothetical protein